MRAQFGRWSKMSTAEKSSLDTGQTPSATTTCAPSVTSRPSTSSAAASLAKTFLPQAKELASLVLEAASGGNSPASLRQTGQLGLSLRTSQAEPSDGLMPCVGLWDSSATKRYRSQLRRQMSGLHTCDGESSLLPTPTAGDAKASGSRRKAGSKAKPGVSLTDVVVHGQALHEHHDRTKGGHLAPQFVEWMMGLAANWTVPASEL